MAIPELTDKLLRGFFFPPGRTMASARAAPFHFDLKFPQYS
jgi:hypothetical protein